MKHIKVTGLVAGLALLGACAPSQDSTLTQFFRPVGDEVNTGHFGRANQNNIAVQTGSSQFRIDLANRFSAEVNPMVNFAFNRAALDATARETLAEQARWIRQFPEVHFKVYGHTDAVGSNAYNKRLGLRRARTVVNFLVSQGVERGRLKAVVSFGESQPLVVSQGRERQNRRTVTEVSGFVSSNPLVLDGKYAEIIYRDYILSSQAESELRTIDSSLIDEQGQ